MANVIDFATAKKARNCSSFTFTLTVNKALLEIDGEKARKDLQKGYMAMLAELNK